MLVHQFRHIRTHSEIRWGPCWCWVTAWAAPGLHCCLRFPASVGSSGWAVQAWPPTPALGNLRQQWRPGAGGPGGHPAPTGTPPMFGVSSYTGLVFYCVRKVQLSCQQEHLLGGWHPLASSGPAAVPWDPLGTSHLVFRTWIRKNPVSLSG